MISEKTRREICDRDGILNPAGYDTHHCFFLSEYYGADRNEAWNIQPLRRGAHDLIHHAPPALVKKGKKLELFCKQKALDRYAGPNRQKLVNILRRKAYGV